MTEGTVDMVLEDAPKLTTPQLEAMLREKYQSDRYALFFDVPDAVSLDARRRIDAVAVGIWQSVGRAVDAFELKVSRADWLRELKQVSKADPFIAICDRFWLVTGDPTVAKLDEIPACWGWMTATKHGLRVQRPAQKLPTDRTNMPWGFTVGLLRKLQDDLVNSPDVRARIEKEIAERTRRIDTEVEYRTKRLQGEIDAINKAVAEFEQASGIKFNRWDMGNIGPIVKQLKALDFRGEGLGHVDKLLERQTNALRITLEQLEEARASIKAITPIEVAA